MLVEYVDNKEIHYAFEEFPGSEPYRYQLFRNGRFVRSKKIYMRSRSEFSALLNHWNKLGNMETAWQYSECSRFLSE